MGRKSLREEGRIINVYEAQLRSVRSVSGSGDKNEHTGVRGR